jgi:hypothetical protein
MRREFAIPALFFGAVSVFVAGFILALVALVAYLAVGTRSVPGGPAVLATMTVLVPVFLPLMVFSFSCLFAAPSGLVAALVFFLGSLLAVRLGLNRYALVLVGGLAGLVGAAVVFPFADHWVHFVGALSGLLSSLVWLRVRKLSWVVTEVIEGRNKEQVNAG